MTEYEQELIKEIIAEVETLPPSPSVERIKILAAILLPKKEENGSV